MSAIDKLRQDAAGMLPKGERSIYNRTQLEAILAEIDALVCERDEARREVCELLYNRQGGWPKEHANERGWNCFEETIR